MLKFLLQVTAHKSTNTEIRLGKCWSFMFGEMCTSKLTLSAVLKWQEIQFWGQEIQSPDSVILSSAICYSVEGDPPPSHSFSLSRSSGDGHTAAVTSPSSPCCNCSGVSGGCECAGILGPAALQYSDRSISSMINESSGLISGSLRWVCKGRPLSAALLLRV